MAGAPEGNTNPVKLKTNELKTEAYRQYCAHIASGIPKKAWCFEHPELTLTWETMEKYIKDDPIVFDPTNKKVAETKSLNHWFGVLSSKATGKNKDADTAALQIIMRNKFKWDVRDHQDEEQTAVSANFEKMMGQLKAMQAISHQH